jgi:hypothetical protein
VIYRFEVLDPRPIPAAAEANEKIFAAGQVLGIEVTVPALGSRCVLGNIDPQHSDGDASRAAIDVALTAALPPDGATLVTIRADLDAVGAMAVFQLRAIGTELSADALARVGKVAATDTFARIGWSGPQPLPTMDNPWPSEGAADSTRNLAAISAAVADFRIPLEGRVALMRRWLLTEEEPAGYRAQVEAERAELISALETGEIKVSLAADGRIAVVESTHRAATAVGYAHAPVVLARNPAFRVGGGDAHTKFTVCTYSPEYADIRSALGELARHEPGWGGSPTIGGSPQGVSSQLTTDEVVSVVTRHLVGWRVVLELLETSDNDAFYRAPAQEVWRIARITSSHAAAEEAVAEIDAEARARAWGTRKGAIRWYFGTI